MVASGEKSFLGIGLFCIFMLGTKPRSLVPYSVVTPCKSKIGLVKFFCSRRRKSFASNVVQLSMDLQTYPLKQYCKLHGSEISIPFWNMLFIICLKDEMIAQ